MGSGPTQGPVQQLQGIFFHFGIMAVIWLVAMGEGVSYQAQQQIKDLGAKNVIVRSVKPPQQTSSGGGGGMFIEYGIKRADFRRILANLPMIEAAVPDFMANGLDENFCFSDAFVPSARGP